MYINSISYNVTNLGPGKRICIWFQGCTLNCKGCFAVSMLKKDKRFLKPVSSVLQAIEKGKDTHTGITVSGGEPFQQPFALYKIAKFTKDNTNLDIMVYTGYTLEELLQQTIQKNDTLISKILNTIDILVDGRFEIDNTNEKIWRGSDNQRFILLSERAKKYKIYENAKYVGKRKILFELQDDFNLKIIGIPDRNFNKILFNSLKAKGLLLKTRL